MPRHDEWNAIAALAMASLRRDSRVEVWAKDPATGRRCFWSARVTRRGAAGFWYVYEGSPREKGYMPMRVGFLRRWRFPLYPASEHFTERTIEALAG